MVGFDFDDGLETAAREAASTLTAYADVLPGGGEAIRERKHLQPALLYALTGLLGAGRVHTELRLPFNHFKGVGGIDLLVGSQSRWQALIELKWCLRDGSYLDWVIWDFYKMATGRISPGADATYVIVGAPDAIWARPGTVGEIFDSREWDMREFFLRHEGIFRGDSEDYRKLCGLPSELRTTVVVNQPLNRKLEGWTLKGIRVDVPTESLRWLELREGQLEAAGAARDLCGRVRDV